MKIHTHEIHVHTFGKQKKKKKKKKWVSAKKERGRPFTVVRESLSR